ncbi:MULTISPECIES: DUF2917 domain-containing protein [Anaeromyxobacter]|uniref:DUF2917 domain-containing protein n=1 Tax=Anaeromyxobacter TaxID=161492 RepID=UPI001F5AF5E1|nr:MULTISPECIES: DUF2917 domain-containing protein [unclassified Anaeromyxobacter]
MFGAWPFGWSVRETGSRELPAEATTRVRPGRRGVVLRAEAGLVHVTQSGDLEDHVLAAGEELRLPAGGLVVAFALAPSRLAVREPRRERSVTIPCPAILPASHQRG